MEKKIYLHTHFRHQSNFFLGNCSHLIKILSYILFSHRNNKQSFKHFENFQHSTNLCALCRLAAKISFILFPKFQVLFNEGISMHKIHTHGTARSICLHQLH